jgi:hypothetical protein
MVTMNRESEELRKLREKLEADVAAFLASGRAIQEIPSGVGVGEGECTPSMAEAMERGRKRAIIQKRGGS